jgi:hypothetical protein
MEPVAAAAASRRAVRVALRLGVEVLASGAETRDVETSPRVSEGELPVNTCQRGGQGNPLVALSGRRHIIDA